MASGDPRLVEIDALGEHAGAAGPGDLRRRLEHLIRRSGPDLELAGCRLHVPAGLAVDVALDDLRLLLVSRLLRRRRELDEATWDRLERGARRLAEEHGRLCRALLRGMMAAIDEL